jgi:hypothetical protein
LTPAVELLIVSDRAGVHRSRGDHESIAWHWLFISGDGSRPCDGCHRDSCAKHFAQHSLNLVAASFHYVNNTLALMV